MPLHYNLGGLAQKFKSRMGLVGASTGKKYLKVLNITDFGVADTTPTTTEFTELGSFTIPAQNEPAVGYGNADAEANQGYLFIELKNSSTQLNGLVRIVISNKDQTRNEVVYEEEIERLRGDANDRMKRVPLPEQIAFPKAGEDSTIRLLVKMDATTQIKLADSIIKVPTTVYI